MERSSPYYSPDADRSEGDEVRFEDDDLVALHATATRASIRQGLRLADAEDTAQETLLALVSRAGGPPANPSAWVHVVATRLARRRRREVAQWVPLDETLPLGPAETLESACQSRLDLAGSLKRLSPRFRNLLLAHHIVGRDLKWIAKELGSTPGSVKVLLWRARDRARTDLER